MAGVWATGSAYRFPSDRESEPRQDAYPEGVPVPAFVQHLRPESQPGRVRFERYRGEIDGMVARSAAEWHIHPAPAIHRMKRGVFPQHPHLLYFALSIYAAPTT